MTTTEASREIAELIKQRKDFMEKIEKSIEKVRSECEHAWVFEPDPSGNNDSCYYCSGCGSYSRKRPK